MGAPSRPGIAETRQRARDLRDELGALPAADQSEIVFTESSPPARYATLYSTVNGEPVPVKMKWLDAWLAKRLPNGQYMFTARQEEAPEYKKGQVRCFLHSESEYRRTGVLEAAGVASTVCFSGNLASKFAMEEIARSKHKKQWQAVQAYLSDQKEQEAIARQEQQTEAMLRMAGAAAKPRRREAAE